MSRVHVIGKALCSINAVLACCSYAQEFPSRPVRVIVPFTPGGGTDLTARVIAQKLTGRWGQQVVVDNRPGAAGNIGAEIVARAAPDGYTLLVITATHTVNAALQSKASYDLLTDLVPLTQVTSLPYLLLVHASLPAKSVRELVALSKARPAGLTYGSSGIGSLGHLAGALLASSTSANLRYIPYKGGAAALADVMAAQIDLTFSTTLQATHVRSGRLRGLAVTTARRSTALPEMPTMMEAGVPGYDINQWNGMLAPRGMPGKLASRLSGDVNAVIALPDVKASLAADGSEAVGTTPAEFSVYIRAEVVKWKKLSQNAGIKIE